MLDKEEVKNLLSALVASGPTPYYMKNLLHDFKKEFGYDLPKFEYDNYLDFLKSVSDVIKLTVCDSVVQVKLVKNTKSAHICSLVERQHLKKSKKKTHLQEKVVSTKHKEAYVVTKGYHQNKNSEVTQDSKNALYKNCKIHKENLNSNKSSSVNSERDLTNSNAQLNVKKSNNSPPNQSTIEENVEKKSDYNYKISNELKVINEMAIIKLSDKAEKFVQININIVTDICNIPKLDLKSQVTIGDYIEVCVTHVHTPHNFSFQLRKFKTKIRNLINQLQFFYNQDLKNYEIPEHLIKADLACVTLYKAKNKYPEWHRSVVIDILNYSIVLVKLLDFGKILEVPIKNLRFLNHQFAQFPIQALNGHLAYIKSNGDKIWPIKTIERFEDLVLDKDLIAGVVNLNYKELWLSVFLSNTNGTEIHISDTLVEEKLAEFDMNQYFPERFLSLYSNFEEDNHENKHPNMQKSLIFSHILKSCKSNSKELVHETLKYSQNNIKLRALFAPSLTAINNTLSKA